MTPGRVSVLDAHCGAVLHTIPVSGDPVAVAVDDAVALFAPDSSAMADNARRWWAADPAAAGPLGTPDHNPAGYAHVSPRRYFRRGQPPVLLVQGTADDRMLTPLRSPGR